MSRLITILILAGVLYWLVKRALFPARGRAVRRGKEEEEMVQDPVCGCYLPKSQSIAFTFQGKTFFFCSQECFQKYQASNSLPKS
jgi:uncharacterized protein